MKKTIIITALLLILTFVFVSCGTSSEEGQKNDPANATATPLPTPLPSPTPVSIDLDSISEEEMNALRAVMPDALPGGSPFTILSRNMSFDAGSEGYSFAGNSKGSVGFVDTNSGAIYGQAVRFAAKNDSEDKRGEIEVSVKGSVKAEGAKGILFYVDFTNVKAKEGEQMCASVTMNVNNFRCNMPEGGSTGFCYSEGKWTETHNVTACRMAIPDNFKGWIYLPATSFIGKDGLGILQKDTDVFDFIFVENMRCYTDGYVYDASSYIIFDEICFVK